MSDDAFLDVPLQPLFITGTKGRLFCLYTPAKDIHREVFLFLPSFAEEMNRCRVMVAMQARLLGAQGYGCLLLDYHGTGDSDGDFADTAWEQWRDDALTAYHWLASQGYEHVVLWGVRVGALLAAELASQERQYFSRLILWQPVLDGQAFLTQFFRIRLAMLMDRGEQKETTQQMRQQLQQGHNIEVAGYTITPEIAIALDTKKISVYQDIEIPMDWFEVVMDGEGAFSLASQKIIAAWRQRGITVNTYSYQGPAFWQLHERELTPELLEKTTTLFL